MIASQAMMLNSPMAHSIFLTQAASLQAQVAGRQGSRVSAQAAAITATQHSFALQKQLHVHSAILEHAESRNRERVCDAESGATHKLRKKR
jgi:hypothetical protein